MVKRLQTFLGGVSAARVNALAMIAGMAFLAIAGFKVDDVVGFVVIGLSLIAIGVERR